MEFYREKLKIIKGNSINDLEKLFDEWAERRQVMGLQMMRENDNSSNWIMFIRWKE